VLLGLPAGVAAWVVAWAAVALVEHMGDWHFGWDPSLIGGLIGLVVMLAVGRSGKMPAAGSDE
jgi:hypothetical protein